MAKGDAYYLKHDNDAFSDPKIIKLRMVHGFEAYALYWRMLEMMFGEDENVLAYSDTTFNLIEFETRTNLPVSEFVKTCLSIGLFELDEAEEYFYSPSLNRRMEAIKEYSELQSERGKKGAEARWGIKASANNDNSASIAQVWRKHDPAMAVNSHEMRRDEKRRDEKKREEKTRDDRGNLKTIYKEGFGKRDVVVGVEDHVKKEKDQELKPDMVLTEYMNIMDPLPTAAQMDQLDRWQDKGGLEPEVLIAAMHTAVDNGKRSFSYLRGIVKNLIGDGVKTMAQYQKREEEYQGRAKKGGTASGTSMNRDNYDTAEAGESDYDVSFGLTYPKIAGGGK